MFGVVWDYYNSKLKGKQYKQNISPKSHKTEIKFIAKGPVALGDKNLVSSAEFQEKFGLTNFCSKIFVKRGRTGNWQSHLLCLKRQSNCLPFSNQISNIHFRDAHQFSSSFNYVSYRFLFCAAAAEASAIEQVSLGEIDLELCCTFIIYDLAWKNLGAVKVKWTPSLFLFICQ